ncbi:FIGNL1-interacting regulator of recombination and mitosis isoform 1-T2 [Synchiropus picturatus]
MSQTNTSLLDEVVQWSQETCRQEIKSVLPKLTALNNKSEKWDDHLRVLKIITDMFLPHIALTELDNECFSQILPKAVTVFNAMVKEISAQVEGLSSQNTELCSYLRNVLQLMMQIINAMSTCVRHVVALDEPFDLVSIRSLPTCILQILRGTFEHCKESEAFYCGRLSFVADLLQGLFKEAYSLQKSLLDLLERMSIDISASEDEVTDIVTVIHSLYDICSVISNLDIALHANTWKFLIKQCLKYRPLVEEHLHHGDICNSLCENLLASFTHCVELAEQVTQTGLQGATQSPEYKLFQKMAKMCRFFANTLVHYIKEFKVFLNAHRSSFHQLYLQILSKFPPSLCSPELPPALSGELDVAALIPMNAFLLQLLPLRSFAEVVLHNDLRLSSEHELPHCLLLTNVLHQLASQPQEVLQLWYTGSLFPEDTPRLSLYQAIFASFRRCYTERRVPVLLPGVMMKGQAQVKVSLHHHLCVHLCASVAALPPEYFNALECSLVEAVLQADTQTALLATDVWCFTARYGSAELCLHHVLLIAQLVKSCPSECHQLTHLSQLLRRLLFFMTPKHQMELVVRFPPSCLENLRLWRHILLRALSQDVRHRVVCGITALNEKTLSDWQDGGFKLGQVATLNVALRSLLVVAKDTAALEEQQVLSAARIVSQLWLRMTPDQVLIHPLLQLTLRPLLLLTAMLVKNIEPQVIRQAVMCVDALVTNTCSEELILAALDFLSSLGKIFIPPHSQGETLPKLSGLFATVLALKSWLLHQHALEAFATFAEITNHEEVISHSLSVEETKNKVVSFLSKSVTAQEDGESRLKRLRVETQVVEQHLLSLKTPASCMSMDDEATESEPSLKRARLKPTTEDYSRYVQTAESSLRALLTLQEGKGSGSPAAPPLWLESKLQELQRIISQIRVERRTI